MEDTDHARQAYEEATRIDQYLAKLNVIGRNFLYREDATINLNYCIFLYNQGERRAAAQQFSLFEKKWQKAQKVNETVDQEVKMYLVLKYG